MSECIGEQHKWSLSISEGNAGVRTEPCGEECDFSSGDLGDNAEWIELSDTPVSVSWGTDCTAYDTDEDCVPLGPPKTTYPYESGSHYVHHGVRCDCNWWPVVKLSS